MPSYRFCRSDDVPLLVEAYEACYRVHSPGAPGLTVDGFKRWTRTLDLWTSSCMVATVGDEPVSVLLATKRDDEALVWAVGTKPGHERRGHAGHLLDSLASKQAILGPPRIVAEVPQDRDGPRALFEACGYRLERTLTDFELDAQVEPPPGAELVVTARWGELIEHGAPPPRARCWERSAATLARRKHEIAALAVVSDARVEAWLAYEPDEASPARTVMGFGCADPARDAVWARLLVGVLVSSSGRPLRLPRADPDEIAFDVLTAIGFHPGARTSVCARRATLPSHESPILR